MLNGCAAKEGSGEDADRPTATVSIRCDTAVANGMAEEDKWKGIIPEDGCILPETEVEFICDIPDKGRTEDLCNQINIPPHRSKHRQPAAVGHTAHVDHVIRHEAPATDTAASNKKVSPDDTAGQNVSSSEDNNLFFYGNIRSGQTLEVKKSIIIGNVEKRAKVISGGNIIILGSLQGSAVAGKDLQKKRFVLALTMEPVHIKIGTVSYAAKRQFHDKLNTKDAVIAYCENDQLIFQPLSQASL